jgi:hypothetical protein
MTEIIAAKRIRGRRQHQGHQRETNLQQAQAHASARRAVRPVFVDPGMRVKLALDEFRTLNGGCVLVRYSVKT